MVGYPSMRSVSSVRSRFTYKQNMAMQYLYCDAGVWREKLGCIQTERYQLIVTVFRSRRKMVGMYMELS